MKKLKLKSMEKVDKKVKLTTTQGNVIKFQEQGDVAFQILVKSQLVPQPIDIEELMTYSITPVPHCLGTPDGYMAKTNKAASVHYLTCEVSDAELPSASSGETLFIEDGNAHFHTLKDLPATFKGICLKLLDQLSRKPDVVFSTDMYVENSIKSQERQRRGSSAKIILEGINTRKPSDFKVPLQNDENKKQLCKFMLHIWGSPEAAHQLQGRRVILVVWGGHFSCLLQMNNQSNKKKSHIWSQTRKREIPVLFFTCFMQGNMVRSILLSIVQTVTSPSSWCLLHRS